MNGKLVVLGLCLLVLVTVPVTCAVSGVGWWAAEAAGVARDEFGPRAAVRKYEWFKDAWTQLQAREANIKERKTQLASLEAAYAGMPRPQWDRVDKQTWAQISAEISGMVAAYNDLAAEYNASRSKATFGFAEMGLPEQVVPMKAE
jgi:hypothetical protein